MVTFPSVREIKTNYHGTNPCSASVKFIFKLNCHMTNLINFHMECGKKKDLLFWLCQLLCYCSAAIRENGKKNNNCNF